MQRQVREQLRKAPDRENDASTNTALEGNWKRFASGSSTSAASNSTAKNRMPGSMPDSMSFLEC